MGGGGRGREGAGLCGLQATSLGWGMGSSLLSRGDAPPGGPAAAQGSLGERRVSRRVCPAGCRWGEDVLEK